MEIFKYILQVGFGLSGIILIVLVLMRKSEVGGLSSAFGGMGDTAFGVKTQKQLDKVITYISIFFFVVAVLLNTSKFRHIDTTTPTPPTPPVKEAPAVPSAPAETPKPPAETPQQP